MKIFVFLQEPANYTLDLIDNIYNPRGVSFVFLKLTSSASNMAHKSCEALSICSFGVKVRRIWQVLKEYDAIIVNGYTGFDCLLIIWMNIIFFRRPMAQDSDTELRIPNNSVKRLFKWLWLHFLFTRKYSYGFAGGNYGHKDLFRHYGMAEERIFLMPMMVDNVKYMCEKAELQQHNGIFRFGYLGRLIPLKQVDKVIQAVQYLVGQGLSIEFVVIGNGEEKDKLIKLSSRLPVRLLGALFGEEKIKALHSLDCLILYSSYESWGLVVNEALASGIPVIVSDKVGARRDLVEGASPTGLVANWTDVKELAEKMRMMATDDSMRRLMQINAIKRMKNWDYGLYGRNLDAWIAKLNEERK